MGPLTFIRPLVVMGSWQFKDKNYIRRLTISDKFYITITNTHIKNTFANCWEVHEGIDRAKYITWFVCWLFPTFFSFLQLKPEPALSLLPLISLQNSITYHQTSKILKYVLSGLQTLEEDLVEGIESFMLARVPLWKEDMVSELIL